MTDLIFHGCRLGGVSKLLEEARTCKREECMGINGMTQLIRATWNNDVERARHLFRLDCPIAVVNARTVGGATALHIASERGYEAIVRELLAHGAEVNIKDIDGMTPLMMASYYGHLAVVRQLSDTPGVDLAARNGSLFRNALGMAMAYDNSEVAAFLRSRGAPELLLSAAASSIWW